MTALLARLPHWFGCERRQDVWAGQSLDSLCVFFCGACPVRPRQCVTLDNGARALLGRCGLEPVVSFVAAAVRGALGAYPSKAHISEWLV